MTHGPIGAQLEHAGTCHKLYRQCVNMTTLHNYSDSDTDNTCARVFEHACMLSLLYPGHVKGLWKLSLSRSRRLEDDGTTLSPAACMHPMWHPDKLKDERDMLRHAETGIPRDILQNSLTKAGTTGASRQSCPTSQIMTCSQLHPQRTALQGFQKSTGTLTCHLRTGFRTFPNPSWHISAETRNRPVDRPWTDLTNLKIT